MSNEKSVSNQRSSLLQKNILASFLIKGWSAHDAAVQRFGDLALEERELFQLDAARARHLGVAHVRVVHLGEELGGGIGRLVVRPDAHAQHLVEREGVEQLVDGAVAVAHADDVVADRRRDAGDEGGAGELALAVDLLDRALGLVEGDLDDRLVVDAVHRALRAAADDLEPVGRDAAVGLGEIGRAHV